MMHKLRLTICIALMFGCVISGCGTKTEPLVDQSQVNTPSPNTNTITPSPPANPSSPAAYRPYRARAGRSPLLQPGEKFKKPIAPKRLLPEQAQSKATINADGTIAWYEAKQFVGQTVTVKGLVIKTNNTGRVCFLNFTDNWRGTFYAVIFKDVLQSWPTSPEKYFLNKKVHITGKVYMYRTRPQIRIKKADQIRIVKN